MNNRLFLFFASCLIFFLSFTLSLSAEGMLPTGEGDSIGQMTGAQITGFRSAKFGMTENELKKAILADFPLSKEKIISDIHLTQKTKVFVVQVDNLLPDSGPASITYVLGYQSQTLIHISIVWTGKEQDLGSSAILLRDYFNGQDFSKDKVVNNMTLANGSMLAFRGLDKNGRLVQILLTKPDVNPDAKNDKADLQTAVRLELTYASNPEHPDVFSIKPGDF
jgi:hypothetical protein